MKVLCSPIDFSLDRVRRGESERIGVAGDIDVVVLVHGDAPAKIVTIRAAEVGREDELITSSIEFCDEAIAKQTATGVR
jgi:hypothetical protein